MRAPGATLSRRSCGSPCKTRGRAMIFSAWRVGRMLTSPCLPAGALPGRTNGMNCNGATKRIYGLTVLKLPAANL